MKKNTISTEELKLMILLGTPYLTEPVKIEGDSYIIKFIGGSPIETSHERLFTTEPAMYTFDSTVREHFTWTLLENNYSLELIRVMFTKEYHDLVMKRVTQEDIIGRMSNITDKEFRTNLQKLFK